MFLQGLVRHWQGLFLQPHCIPTIHGGHVARERPSSLNTKFDSLHSVPGRAADKTIYDPTICIVKEYHLICSSTPGLAFSVARDEANLISSNNRCKYGSSKV